MENVSFREVFVYFLCCLYTACHSPYYERGTTLGIAADKDIVRVFGVLRLQKSHGQQTKFGLDDLGLALLYHDGTAAIRIWLPVDFLNLNTSQTAVLAQELKRVDVPTAGASLFVR